MRDGAGERSIAVDVSAIVKNAMDSLPVAHRAIVGGAYGVEYEVVERPIGEAVDHYRRSAGLEPLPLHEIGRLESAYGVWIKDLRVILIRGGHPGFAGMSAAAVEQFVARVVWHEVGHALSIVHCSRQDVRAGRRLLDLCPPAIADNVRAANYGVLSFTYEVVAEVFALLMERRQRGEDGRPKWLDPEIYELICRVTGWAG